MLLNVSISFQLESRCLQSRTLILTQFIPDVMSFRNSSEFSSHKSHVELQADKIHTRP